MNIELRALLEKYVTGQAAISDLTDWIALNAWDATPAEEGDIGELAVELAYLDDGYSEGARFRRRVREMLTAASAAAKP